VRYDGYVAWHQGRAQPPASLMGDQTTSSFFLFGAIQVRGGHDSKGCVGLGGTAFWCWFRLSLAMQSPQDRH
jgi:hypothetical protein